MIGTRLDPQYNDEVSGCTASTALISDTKIYVVSIAQDLHLINANSRKGQCR